MLTLHIDLEILTPLFLGGAQQQPELRPASFRGALRHWYRAIDTDFHLYEARYFGGVGKDQGQSPFLLRLRSKGPPPKMKWPDEDDLNKPPFKQGDGPDTKNGVKYLGFIFNMAGEERKLESNHVERRAIAPGARFHATCSIPRPKRLERRGWRALLASCWLLGHLGSLGTRARRGFGSLAISDWRLRGEIPPGWQDDFDGLPLLINMESVETGAASIEATRNRIAEWFSTPTPHQTPANLPYILGPASNAVLFRRNHTTGPSLREWGSPLSEAGLKFQSFRTNQVADQDRPRARDHARWLNRKAGGQHLAGDALQGTSFGLPLTYRFKTLDKDEPPKKDFKLLPAGDDALKKPQQRHPSPIWIRVVRLADGDHVLVTRLDGTLPGQVGGVIADPGPPGKTLSAHDGKILDAFMSYIASSGVEIKLGGNG